jgi:hypothetical protein
VESGARRFQSAVARSDAVQIPGERQVEGPQHSHKHDKLLRGSSNVTSGEPFFFYRLFGRARRFHFLFLRDSIRKDRKDCFQLNVYNAVLESAVRSY